jgi:hypothetical protein
MCGMISNYGEYLYNGGRRNLKLLGFFKFFGANGKKTASF